MNNRTTEDVIVTLSRMSEPYGDMTLSPDTMESLNPVNQEQIRVLFGYLPKYHRILYWKGPHA
jgi:hypothetical protein